MRKLMLIGVMCAWSLGRVNAQTNVPPSIKASSYYVYEFWDAVGTDKIWTYLGDPYEPQPPHVYVKVKEEIISWWTTDPGDPAYQSYMAAFNVGTNEGSFTYWKYFDDPYNEDYSTDSYPGTGPAFEMAANGPWIHRDSGHEYYNLLIEWTPELALHTGGPTNSTANRLFKINVWARELVYESLFGFDIEDAFEILPGNIRILGQTPDESGNLYVYLADHSVVDITPTIMQTNVMSYEFNLSASLFTGSTTNTVIDCGSLLSPGLLSVTNYHVCLGGSISPPTATAPLFTDGQIRSTVVDHLNGTTNTTTNSFTYTVGPLYFVPPIPSAFTNAGTHTFTAMVNLTPAITNCPVINATVGTITVIAAQPTTNVTYQCGTITNLPTFDLTNIVCVSNTVALPPIDTDRFLPGQILVSIVDCATGLTNTTNYAITYPPTIRVESNFPTNGFFDTPGVFPYDIYVDGISSTNACPNLSVLAGRFTVIVSKVDIVQTNEFVCVGGLAGFQVTPNSSSPIFWSIVPDLGTNGAYFTTTNVGASVTINAGTNAAPYTILAHDAGSNCFDTATLNVQRLLLTPASTNVFVNADDDNGNGTNDVADALSGAGSEVSGENDLVPLTLQFDNPATNQTITLTIPTGIRLWTNSARGPGVPLPSPSSWPAQALPTAFFIEGVPPSTTMGDVTLTLAASPGCSASTNLTVIDVASVLFQTNHSPLLVNSNAGGELALFPDRPTPGDTNDYSSVRVVVTLQPPMTNLPIYLRSFDVDDPSSGHALPLDDEGQPQDNKAQSHKAGRLGGGGDTLTLLSGTNGVAWTNFNVTMQPGDNFRVIASPLADFQNHYQAVQTNMSGAIALTGSMTNEIPSKYRTKMLTVWRRLHVEVDSMAAVPPYTNSVSGLITSLLGTQSMGATQANLNLSLVSGLTPVDNSPNLASGPTSHGRFENGAILIGTPADQAITAGLLGNGPHYVQTTNGGSLSIPFTIINSNGTTTASGQVWAMEPNANGTLFYVGPNLPTAVFDGGNVVVAGHSFPVDVNTPSSVRVIDTAATLGFALVDDDDNSLLPKLLWPLENPLSEAYIRLVQTAAETRDTNVSFVLNLGDEHTVLTANFDELNHGTSSGYWVVCLLGCYQYLPHIMTTGPIGDLDPNSGDGGVGGLATGADVVSAGDHGIGGFGAFVYLETIRDRLANTGADAGLGERVATHELGHALGLQHNTLGGVMFSTVQAAQPNGLPFQFLPLELHHLRKRVNSPGR